MGVVINCNDLWLNGGMAVDVIAKIRVFAADRRGGIALVFGFALPVLGIGAAAVMEYSSLSRRGLRFSGPWIGPPLAAARELSLVNADETRVPSVGRGVIVSSLTHGSTVPASVSVAVINDRSAVEVQASQAVDSVMEQDVSLPRRSCRRGDHQAIRGVARDMPCWASSPGMAGYGHPDEEGCAAHRRAVLGLLELEEHDSD